MKALKTATRRYRPWDIMRFVAHLPSFVRLFTGLLRDHRVSALAKAVLLGAGVYVVAPVDILADIVPVLGQMDDVAVLMMAARFFFQLCPRAVVAEHVARIDRTGKWAPFE